MPPPGDLLNPVIKPRSPALRMDSLLSQSPGKPGDQILTMCLGFRDRDLNWNVTVSSTRCVIFNPKPVYYSVKWAYLTYTQKSC